MRIAFVYLTLVVSATCSFAQEEYRVIAFKPDPAFALDGDLSDWVDVPGAIMYDSAEQVHVGPSKWSGPEDLGGRITLAWRSEGLYLGAHITDAQLFQSERAAMIYKGDHIEVFLDVTPDADLARTNWGEGQYQFGISPGNFRKTGDPISDVAAEAYGYLPPGLDAGEVRVVSTRTEGGYDLEALMPWSTMGVAPRQNLPISIEVALSDCDSQEPAQEGYMTIGTERWRHSRERLQPMLLGDADGAASPPARKAVIRDEMDMGHGETQTIEFEAPAVPEGKAGSLFFSGRIAFDVPAGYAPALELALNGQRIEGARLINRPMTSTYRYGKTMNFVTGDGLIALCYGPDFDATDAHSTYGLVDTPRACDYEFLVTDLLVEGTNTLEMVTRPDKRDAWHFHFADLALLFKAPPPPEAERRPAPTGDIPWIAPRAEFSKQYNVEEPGPGLLRVSVGGESFDVQSRFSTPDGEWNRSGNEFFGHERRIEEKPEGITVFDTFTNLTEENLPLTQRHECVLGERLKQKWLAGQSPYSDDVSISQHANPTTFGVTESAGIGLMPENDVFQVHVVNYSLSGTLGVADNSFVLGPGASYTAEWTIVPLAGTDFWDFINAARRLRDANFTLPYQFAFLSAREHDEDFLRRFMEHKTPDLVCASIGYPRYNGVYAHGTAFQHVDHSYYARHNARIEEMFPEVKTSVYYHCFLDVIDDGETTYADARTLRPDGTQATYGRPYDKIFFPTLENTFGRDTARNIDYIWDQCAADGVYWDELAYSAYQYHYGEPWDGCSGDIDPSTHQLTRLRSSVTLISQPWRVRELQRCMEYGPFIANGQPHTRTIARLKFQRFVETASISNCLRAILYSPIALGDHIAEKNGQDAYRWMLKALNYGCVYNWYSESVATGYPTLASHMFPITPMELHEGYIIGAERIVTNRSGNFGWGDQSEHEVHVYDETGREVEDFNAPLITKDGATFTELRIAEDWSAAIIRNE